MKELNELEAGVLRLKKNEEQQRRIIQVLEKEKEELIGRSRELSERLNSMQQSYQEASQRVMDFVKNQIDPIKERLAEVGVELKSIGGIQNELDSQKKRGEKQDSAIGRIIGEIGLVQKDLENISALRAGLKEQSKALEQTRLVMIKEMERSMDSIKRDFETKRVEDLKNQMKEFRSEIKRIAGIEEEFRSYKKTQDNAFYRLSQTIVSMEEQLSEIKHIRKKADDAEGFTKMLDGRIEKISQTQGEMLSGVRSELLKDLQKAAESIRKEFEAKRVDDARGQMAEFKSEIARISNIEEEVRGYKKSHDTELARVGRGLDSLKETPSEIKSLKGNLAEIDSLLKGMAKNAVNRSEFSELLAGINKRVEDAENRFFSLDRKLSAERSAIEKQIMELASDEKIMKKTQESVRKAVSERVIDVEGRLTDSLKVISDQAKANSAIIENIRQGIAGIGAVKENSQAIQSLRERLTGLELASKQLAENTGALERLKERTQGIDSATRELPKRVGAIENALIKIGEARDVLFERSKSLSEQLRALDASMSEERQRLAAIEKEFGVTDKKKESRLDRIDKDIGEIRKSFAEVDTIRSRLESSEAFTRVLDDKMGRGLEKIKAELEKELQKESADKLSRITDEMKRLSTLSSEMDAHEKSQEKRFDRVQKDIVSLQDSASRIPELKSELEVIESAVQEGASELKVLRSSHDSSLKSTGTAIDELYARTEKEFSAISARLQESAKGMSEIRRLVDSYSGIPRQVSDNIKLLGSLKERVTAIDVAVSEISKSSGLIAKIKDRIADIGMLPEHEKEIKGMSERLAVMDSSLKSMSGHDAEIKNLFQRVSSLEPLLEDSEKQGSLIEGLSKNVLGLESFAKAAQAGIAGMEPLRERVTRIEGRVRDISENSEELGELVERVSGIESVVKQLPKTVDTVQKIRDALADLKFVPKAVAEINKVRERVAALEMNTRSLAKTMGGLDAVASRVSELESESGIYGSFSEQLKNLEKSLTEDRRRIAAIEKEFGVTDKKKESRLGALFQDMASARKELDAQRKYIDRLADEQKGIFSALRVDFRDAVKKVSDEQKSFSDSMRVEIDSRVKELSKEIKDLSVMRQRIEDHSGVIDELSEKYDVSVASLRKEMGESVRRVADEQKASLSSLRKDMDTLAKSVSASQKSLSDSLDTDIEKRSKELSAEIKGISLMRQKIADHSKAIESLSGEQGSSVSSLRKQMETAVKRVSDEQKSFSDSMRVEIDSRVKELSKEIKDLSVMRQRIEDHSGVIDELSEKYDVSVASLRKEMGESVRRVADEQKAMLSSMRTEMGEIRKEQSGLRMKDIKEWLSRTKEIEKELNSYRSGSEKRMSRISEEIVSLGDELKAQALVSTNLTKSLTRVEGMIADVQALKEGVDYLSKMSDGMNKDSVKGPEFVQTISSISKRLDEAESGISELTGKHDSGSDEVRDLINKAASDIGLLRASQGEIQKVMKQRIDSIEKTLSGDVSEIAAKTESGLAEIGKIKEKIAGLSKLESLSNISADEIGDIGKKVAVMDSLINVFSTNSSKLKEMAGKLSAIAPAMDKIRGLENDSKTFMKEIRGLHGEILAERERVSRIETEIGSSAKQQEMRARQIMEDHRKVVLAEVKKDLTGMVKEFELSEEKRKKEFDGILRESRNLESKTEEKIKDFAREIASMPGMEEKLKESIEKVGVQSMNRIKENQERLVKRITESEKTVKHLSGVVTDLRTRIQVVKDYERAIDDRVNELRDEVISRMKTNEDIMDSEMDAFKNKVDFLMGQLEVIKEFQERGFDRKAFEYPKQEGSFEASHDADSGITIPMNRKEEINVIKKLSSKL